MKILRTMLTGIAVAATVMAPSAAFAASTPSPSPTTVSVDGVSVASSLGVDTAAELDSFLLSSTPKAIMVHAATGQVVSVAPISDVASIQSAWTSICYTGNACLVHSMAPYADYGFSGIGTTTGSWAHRIQWKTGKYTAKAWYSYNGSKVGWGGVFGPGSTIGIDGEVTAVQVTIYS